MVNFRISRSGPLQTVGTSTTSLGSDLHRRVRVGILNPLPGVLAHFEDAIVDNLELTEGIEAVRFSVKGAEMPEGAGQRDRLESALRLVVDARRQIAASKVDCLINLWPTFGYLEPVVWRSLFLDAAVLTILHDVTPLRPQFGYWPQAIGPLRLGSEGRHSWIVHTADAQAEARALGLGEPTIIPHPILPEQVGEQTRDTDVLVFGQMKPARDLELLAALGDELRKAGLRGRIVGRGWPSIEGWEVDDRFVPEEEVPGLLGSAKSLLLPYVHYYQSGVALRAIEVGTPVVGTRNGFLEDYLGADWRCFVEGSDPNDWLTAVELAIAGGVSLNTVNLGVAARGRIGENWSEALLRNFGGFAPSL